MTHAPTSPVRRRYPIGAEVDERGTSFRVWAPHARQLVLMIESPSPRALAMEPEAGGYFALHVPDVAAGARYRLRIDRSGEAAFADPASRFQPDGPFGPSLVVDPRAFAWTDRRWPGITDPARQVLYELHVGTFTPEGSLAAASEQLRVLAELGVTTLELMPLNDYAGTRGWGYDGVNLFAPCRNHGTPDDLRRFVDRAHALSLAVILDVVYNHLGPAGNSLFRFAPYARETGEANEWGEALDYSNPGVRELFTTNAAYWIDEFHLDGLRLDATQAIADEHDPHLVAELVRRARAAAGAKPIFVVAENEPQDRRLFDDYGVDALWNDDFEHSARVALTGVRDGYFHDYRGTAQELVSAVKRGFLYQGQLYAWQRNTRGTSTRGLAPARFVHYLEDHDQVANVGFGDRLSRLTDPASLRALTALLLLSPQLPMLFQGQETGSTRPWRFFVDHDPELNRLVRAGRAEFLTQFARLASSEVRAVLPDPGAPETFASCVLDPHERVFASPMMRLHRDLLALRRAHPAFTDQRAGALDGAVLDERAFCLRWWHEAGDRLLLVNLGPTLRETILPEPLLAPPEHSGWAIAWSSEHPDYGGHGTPEPFTLKRLAISAHAAVLCAPDPRAYLRVDPSPPSGGKDAIDP
jgi:maltooligosyltrehalose trehalohydrolase